MTGSSIPIVVGRLRRNVAEAEGDVPTALLVRKGIIGLLGDDQAVADTAVDEGIRVLDAAGATVTPGSWTPTRTPLGSQHHRGSGLRRRDHPEGVQSALREEAARSGPEDWVRG